MNRRGFIQDTLYLLVVLFIMAVTLLAIYYGFGVLSDGLHSGAIPEENLVAFDDNYDRFPSIWDYTFLTLYVVFVIGGMIVSYSLPSNPAFMIVALLVFVILAAIAGFLANTWEAVSEDTVLGLSAQSFPIMNYMISNYILFILVAAALILVAFYAKPESY